MPIHHGKKKCAAFKFCTKRAYFLHIPTYFNFSAHFLAVVHRYYDFCFDAIPATNIA